MAYTKLVSAPGLSLSWAKVCRLLLLSPFALLYGTGVWLRNKLFDWGIWQPGIYPVPVVCVGNLELGGSGKTPTSDWLIEKLHRKYKIAYLSRGYMRRTTGTTVATDRHDADDLGDEPYLIFQKWKDVIYLVVDEDRRRGINLILDRFPDVSLILMDDGFQHRWVKPRFSILLTPWKQPFFRNYLFPSGTLRDMRSQYKRAQAVVFSKCPDLSKERLQALEEQWKNLGLHPTPLFLSSFHYLSARNRKGEELKENAVVNLVAGLADNRPFFERATEIYRINQCISKPDHYRYLPAFFKENDLENQIVLTTEKDFSKLLKLAPDPDRIYFIPIRIALFPEEKFIQTLENHL